ncbi:MAG: hypothetical protein ACI8VC_000625 [Candidatus Endobugula sp.]|jgi:hypothetical protein
MKKLLLALAVAGAAVSAQADVELSGHVSYKIGDTREIKEDRGTGTEDEAATNRDLSINDNGNSGSRFRIVASHTVNDVTWGTNQEFGINAANNGEDDSDAVSIRKNELYAKGNFGKVSFGQGSEAGDDATTMDYSGTGLLNDGTGAFGGGVDTADGGRTERLRYDSPKLGGIAAVAVSFNSSETNYEIKGSAGNFKAGLYGQSNKAADSDEFGGSVAAKFGAVSVAYQFSELETATADDKKASNLIIGYKIGDLSLAVDFGDYSYGAATNDVDHTGFSLVHNTAKGVELYTGYRTVDVTGTVNDGDGFVVGARVKF